MMQAQVDVVFLVVLSRTILQLLMLCGGAIAAILVVYLVIHLLGGAHEEPR